MEVDKKGHWNNSETFVLTVVITLVLAFLLVWSTSSGEVIKTKTITVQTKLYSIDTSNNINGSFILGTGEINQKKYYYFNEVVSENPLRLNPKKIPFNRYNIVLKDNINYAYIEHVYDIKTIKPLIGKQYDNQITKDEYLVIPKNHLEQHYNLN